LTAVFSHDELLTEKFRSTKAHSCPFAGSRGRGRRCRVRERRLVMADSTGKFGVGGLHHLGIPSRRQFFQLGAGAGAAAGWTYSGNALAQTERPSNPPDKPRGQVIAALSQEPTVFHPLMPGI